ncbi:MAG TPA: hypothetical protein VNM92_17795, partial [Thermoanaerobaculia bacterium]|nr:hypothetical protein [Thermoanaerobaculia bacterium]
LVGSFGTLALHRSVPHFRFDSFFQTHRSERDQGDAFSFTKPAEDLPFQCPATMVMTFTDCYE